MTRTSAALLLACGFLIGLASIASAAQVTLDVDPPTDLTTPEIPVETPPTVEDVHDQLDALLSASFQLDTALATPDEPPAEEPSVAPQSGATPETADGVLLSPEQREAALAATAATGLAVLLGLAAYYWGGPLLPLFSRIDSNKMLDNDIRHRVHEAVANNPGVTIKEVTLLVGIGWGTAVYHLKRLEAERLVVSERNRQFRRYFKNGGGIVNESKAAFSELKNPTSHKIASTLLARPGVCQKDVCASVGISAPLASKYLSRLEDAGLVATQRDWKTVKYFPTPRLEDLLAANKIEGAPLEKTLASTPIALAA